MRVKAAVHFEEKVFGPAVNTHLRPRAEFAFSETVGESVKIVGAADGILADDESEFLVIWIGMGVREIRRTRMADGRAEHIGVAEREFQRAVAAHRKPGE